MAPEDERPFAIGCAPPFLTARFSAPQRTLGWSLTHPGFATIRDVVWLEVRGPDLVGVDALELLRAKLAAFGHPDALAFMTARDIRRYHVVRHRAEDVQAVCLTTVGLSNAERVGARRARRSAAGTINTLVHVSKPLTQGAMIEAISIAAEARTTAIIEAMQDGDKPCVTGTGTDCIVVACPCDGEPTRWAGLHTAIGEAIGGAVHEATREGVAVWREDIASPTFVAGQARES